jgi:hypothetical protein
LIQESNEDEYYGWVMKRKRMKWSALQQNQGLQLLALRKDRELKNAELEQELMNQKEFCPCGYDTEVFLEKLMKWI